MSWISCPRLGARLHFQALSSFVMRKRDETLNGFFRRAHEWAHARIWRRECRNGRGQGNICLAAYYSFLRFGRLSFDVGLGELLAVERRSNWNAPAALPVASKCRPLPLSKKVPAQDLKLTPASSTARGETTPGKPKGAFLEIQPLSPRVPHC